MTDDRNYPGLDNLNRAIQAGDLEAAREFVYELSADERKLLEAELGADGVAQLYDSARRGRRSEPRGRVILLNGIMGARLSTIDKSGEKDEIWLHALRLMRGRISELELAPDGSSAKPGWKVHVEGHMKSTYLAMLLKLNQDWITRPFAYDWRQDVDVSATALAEEIRTFANGEPVHLVAHSMGGLVSRRFIQMFRDVWNSMRDPTGQGRGGRLIMLGTPNFGSFAIPLALSGEERAVSMLASIDTTHNLRELLMILNTFPGSYQMLPSPRKELGDQHRELFDLAAWGDIPVKKALLDRARAFQEGLHDVIEPDRMVYVAGYDQKTPHSIHIDAPGKFRYDYNRDGDGRVPHALGLLDGVPTFWVKEVHGDLCKNDSVLDAIGDLLSRGATDVLENEKPVRRGAVAEEKDQDPAVQETIPLEFERLKIEVKARTRGGAVLTEEQIVERDIKAKRLAALMVEDYCGHVRSKAVPSVAGAAGPGVDGGDGGATGLGPVPQFPVEVVWGDITKIESDVYAVGHYAGVLPVNAERALDRVVSGGEGKWDWSEGVLRNLTRRGVLRGLLGEIAFYPWATDTSRLVAVVGMGHPGTFGRSELRRVVRDLVSSVMSLPTARSLSMVLIGSGDGNIDYRRALECTLNGLQDALSAGGKSVPSVVQIVEYNRNKAGRIHAHLQKLQTKLGWPVQKKLRQSDSGGVSDEDGLALALAACAISAANGKETSSKALDHLLLDVPKDSGIQERARASLRALAGKPPHDICELATNLQVSRLSDAEAPQDVTTRITFVHDGNAFRSAAIHDTAVVAERALTLDPGLVDELVGRMTDPEAGQVDALSTLLNQLLIHRDLRDVLCRDRPMVFELDRRTAKVHWEMLAQQPAGLEKPKPLGLEVLIARQLRTTYSPAPTFDRPAGHVLRALVVGDPGSPGEGYDLPGARREALEVAALLQSRGVNVEVMVGAPSAKRAGTLRGVRAASRIDVLNELLRGEYDMLHYCGHGDFDPEQPDRVGWIFEGGLLTAHELERLDRAPALVVANACLSGQVSERLARGKTVDAIRTEADLLPTLADEFFRRGVRNYVGTAWEVNDYGAVMFAKQLYGALLPEQGEGATLGEALLTARRELAKNTESFGALWGAYQHYGDPGFRLVRTKARDETRAAGDGESPAASRAQRQRGRKATRRVARASAPRRSGQELFAAATAAQRGAGKVRSAGGSSKATARSRSARAASGTRSGKTPARAAGAREGSASAKGRVASGSAKGRGARRSAGGRSGNR